MSQQLDPNTSPPQPERVSAPVISYAIPSHLANTSGEARRDGKTVVVDKSGRLPHLCVKCGGTPEKVLKRNLTWYPRIAYAGLFAGVLPFAILAVVMQQKATVLVPLCSQHMRSRRRSILIAWGIALAGIGLIVAAFTLADQSWLSVVGILALVAALFVGMNAANPLRPKRIDRQRAYLKGACEQFLSQLPEVETAPLVLRRKA